MERMIIEGMIPLKGEVDLQGSKNSLLPILAATVLLDGEAVLHNCPDLTDVQAAIKILTYLGAKVKRENATLIVDSRGINRYDIPEKLMHEMRSSIVFLGPLLGRMGKAKLSMPGGCEIGLRPIDLHIKAMREFGVIVNDECGEIECTCPKGIKGAEINLSFPSVGATENIMLAACLAKGKTVIINAAREPEIEDLGNFLNACGAKIRGQGEGIIEIHSVKKLKSAEHNVIPDRIVAATYMSACAVTGGKVKINSVSMPHISPVMPIFIESGCQIKTEDNNIIITAPKMLSSFGTIRTMPYPGFPTDFQSPAMTMAAVSKGTTVFIETIFESRYKHVAELLKMCANIKVEGRVAIVEGVDCLCGANVFSPDLRGGTSLVVAGLCARGITVVNNLSHIDRGCERFAEKLNMLGAKIKREDCAGELQEG